MLAAFGFYLFFFGWALLEDFLALLVALEVTCLRCDIFLVMLKKMVFGNTNFSLNILPVCLFTFGSLL